MLCALMSLIERVNSLFDVVFVIVLCLIKVQNANLDFANF